MLKPSHELGIVADDLRVLARKVDALVEAYGQYVDSNTSGIDRSVFESVLLNALDGNALYEIERASRQLADDDAEQAYYARHTLRPRNELRGRCIYLYTAVLAPRTRGR